MPILASLNAKNRSKSPFSIGMLFSIISDLTVNGIILTAYYINTAVFCKWYWRMNVAAAMGPLGPDVPDFT